VMSERRNIPIESFNVGQLKMASTLMGAECFPNPVGWAPMTLLQLERTVVIAMPGPPREVQACFNEHLAKRIENITGFRSYGKKENYLF